MLLCWVVFVTFFPHGCFAQDLKQKQLSITVRTRRSATITCELGESVSASVIHWYKQAAGQQPVRILYYDGSVRRDDGFDKRFSAVKSGDKQYVLLIDGVKAEDAATYYCAYWKRTELNSNSIRLQKPSTLQFKHHQNHIRLTTENCRNLPPSVKAASVAPVTLKQEVLSMTRSAGKTARFVCQIEGLDNIATHPIYWYQQRGTVIRGIVHHQSQETTWLHPDFTSRFNFEIMEDSAICFLIINNIVLSDTATYYCAAKSHAGVVLLNLRTKTSCFVKL
ncbi:uncharacterized protein [Heterodontus francisci]|uniref:uncharacterized protein n=1 Tax=Heterodontus francisci TaxID=7792 RepID=UPI00355C8EE5